MKNTILIILGLITLTAFCYKKEISKTQTLKTQTLKCVLSSDKTIYKIGDLPKLKVKILNETCEDIYLIGSLDGSDLKWRMPYCYFEIIKPKPDTIRYSRCGNMDPLRVEDFRKIRTGEKFDPYDDTWFFPDHTIRQTETFKNSGSYKIQFHYATNSDSLMKFMGNFGYWSKDSDSSAIKSLFSKLLKTDIVSNEIEIRFVD